MDHNKNDIAAILGKGFFGAIPFVGPLAGEIVGNLIPNQRIDRIASLLKALELKIDAEERAKVEERILEEKSVDLMEDGFLLAARALSDERIDHIASLLKKSLTAEDLEHIACKRLLFLLGELSDIEVLILKSYSMGIAQQQEFRRKHQDALTPPIVHLGSPQEVIDKGAIYETHKVNLVRLGLLKRTGMMKAGSSQITALGMLLLRSIDQGDNA